MYVVLDIVIRSTGHGVIGAIPWSWMHGLNYSMALDTNLWALVGYLGEGSLGSDSALGPYL